MAIELSNDGIVWIEDMKITYLNRKAYDIFGYDVHDQIIGKSIFSFIHSDEHERILDSAQRWLRGEAIPAKYELKGLRKDGQPVFVEISVTQTTYQGKGLTLIFIRDITKHKEAEAALQESERKYRTIIETIEDGYYEVDLASRLIFFNDAMARINGYSRDEMMGMRTRQYTDEENYRLLFREFNKVYSTGVPIRGIKYEIITKKGEKRTLQTSASLMRDPSGSPIGFRGIARDITDFIQAQEALRESEERYRTIIETIADGYYEADLSSHMTFVNDALMEISGYSRDEILGMDIRDYINAGSLNALQRDFIQIYNTGIPSRGIQYKVITKDGEIRNIETSATLMRDSSGKPIGFRGIIRDITNLRQAQKALSDSENRFRLIAESSNDFIYEWDIPSGRLEWFGAAAEKLGLLLEEVPTTSISFEKIIHPDDFEYVSKSVRKHLQTGDAYRVEYRVIGREGKIIHLHGAGVAVRDANGRAYKWSGTLSDITKRKNDEVEIRLSLDKLHKVMGGIIQAMVLTVESRDPYTSGHQQRVSRLARAIAQEMDLSKDQIEAVRMAGSVHDLGKISVPAEILSKPTKLTAMEFELLKIHPRTSYDILKDIEFPWTIAQIVLQHHERMDGSGYPVGLRGDELLIESRILMVADVVEAIASHRPYRPALGIETALEEVLLQRGKTFDPAVVDACLKLFQEEGFSFD